MSCKRSKCDPSPSNKKRKSLTLEIKLNIIKDSDDSMKNCELARKFSLSESTVRTILKDREKILEAVKSAQSLNSSIIRKRHGTIAQMETILKMWCYNQVKIMNRPVDQITVCNLAKLIFENVKAEAGEEAEHEKFVASNGWFNRFKNRCNWNSIIETGEGGFKATSNSMNIKKDCKRSAEPKGRDSAVALLKTQELRRPGECSVNSKMEKNEPIRSVPQQNSVATRNKFETLCEEIVKINMSSNPKEALSPCADKLKSSFTTTEEFENFAESLFQYALKSKWNAHAVALFSQHHGDTSVNEVKFHTVMLRKLQELHMERKKSYLEINKFLLDATFACEIFHHIQIEGSCLKVLAHPIIDYLCMLVDGGSLQEIEVFIEQFPKCFENIKENDSSGLDALLSKIRRQIVAETTGITARVMLLEMFELILTDYKPLTQNARILYDSLSKAVVRICD